MAQREYRPFLATKKEVLAFFDEREVVTIHSLIDKFGYRYKGAESRLRLLHREGLIEPLRDRGTWGITRKGERRLIHYDRMSRNSPMVRRVIFGFRSMRKDIEEAASYGGCDKLALRWLKTSDITSTTEAKWLDSTS